MDVSNTFKSGETFWGFTTSTGDKSNEQTVCINEVNIGSETIPLLDSNNSVDFGAQIKELKCSDIVKYPIINVPNILKGRTCVTYTDFSCGLMYTIFNVANRFTLLTCNNETKFDTTIQVFHDTIERSCVAGNDDYCDLHSRL